MNRILKPYMPRLNLEELARAEIQNSPEEKKDEKPEVTAGADFSGANIQLTNDSWIIPEVSYRNNIYTAKLSRTLLDSGALKTQEQWAEYREQAIKSGGFYTGDMPLQHAIFKRVFQEKDKPEAEQIRVFLQEQMRTRYLATLTRIPYQPVGDDLIIHNYHTNDEYKLNELIVGPDREIKQADSKAVEVLLGTRDISEISAVYKWLNQTPAWIWRLNEKPKKVDERVARFSAGSVRAYFVCGSYPACCDASLGVFLAAKKF